MTLREVVNWYDFSGKTAIVTGGTGALGSEIAFALAACGANVAILARTPERPARLNDLNDEAGRVIALHADVLDRASLEAAAAEILREFGSIDLLVNAAGGNHPQATATPDLSFFDLPADALEFVFELNMLGTILPSQVFGRYMADQEAGVILNFSSMTSVRPLTRVVGYGAAKAGVNNFTQWLAVYLAQNAGPQVRVNALGTRLLHRQAESCALAQRRRQPHRAGPDHHRPYAHEPLWRARRTGRRRALAALARISLRHRHRRARGWRIFGL